MKKRFLSVLLALTLCMALLPGAARAANTAGSCGNGVTWSYSNGTLTIQGKGSMHDYVDSTGLYTPTPWHDFHEQIRTVRIGDGVTTIGKDAFYECISLTGVTIPGSVISIGDWAFGYCSSLTSVTIPNSVTTIGGNAFGFCSSLATVSISDHVTIIESSVFQGCDSLTSVVIPNGVTTIRSGAFAACSSLTSVTIPASVTKIWNWAFENGGVLTDVYYGGSESQWKYIDILDGNETLKSANIHYYSPLVSIGSGLAWSYSNGALTIQGTGPMYDYGWDNYEDEVAPWFDYRGEIHTVTIGNGVTAIGDFAFFDCHKLTGVTIPASVTTIGTGAFICFDSLKDVYYSGSESQWKQIHVGKDNQSLTSANIHYNSAGSGAPAAPAFTDVPGWCKNAVNWAVEKKITKGTGGNKFSPNDKCKGTEILTFLWRAADEPKAAAASPFTVASYYQDAVDWAYEKGFIDNTFVPDAPCTRAAAVNFIWQALGRESAPASSFTDVPAGAGYAPAVNWAVAIGVTNGYGNNDFRPNNTCTRGEIVTLLHRAYVPSARLK